MISEISPVPTIVAPTPLETTLVPLNNEQQAKIAEILQSQQQHRRSPFETKLLLDGPDTIVVAPPKITFDENFVADLFRIQQEQKAAIARELEESLTEQERAHATMLRHADALCTSISAKFVKTVQESKELQAILKVDLKPNQPIHFVELLAKMQQVLNEEKAPDDLEKDCVWIKRGVEKALQPIVEDLRVFLKLFNINDVESQCPKMIEEAIATQIKLAITTSHGPSKLQYIGKGFYYTFWTLYVITGILQNVATVAAVIVVAPVISSAKGCIETAKFSVGTAKIVFNALHGLVSLFK